MIPGSDDPLSHSAESQTKPKLPDAKTSVQLPIGGASSTGASTRQAQSPSQSPSQSTKSQTALPPVPSNPENNQTQDIVTATTPVYLRTKQKRKRFPGFKPLKSAGVRPTPLPHASEDEEAATILLDDSKEETFEQFLSQSLLKNLHRPPRVSINSLLLTGVFLVLTVMMGMMAAPLPDLPGSLWASILHLPQPTQPLLYSFQLPFVLFGGALLGPVLGSLMMSTFVLAGLFGWPIFASGGGFDYIYQPGFGYILGFIPAAWLCGKYAKWIFKPTDGASHLVRLGGLVLLGVATVHLCGLLGLFANAVGGNIAWNELGYWFTNLTIKPFAYDFLIGMTLITCMRTIRIVLSPLIY